MRILKLLPLLLLLQTGMTGCADIEIEDTETETFKYWCLISGGAWIVDKDTLTPTTPLNHCQCGGITCGAGIICVTEGNDKVKCAAKPSNSPKM